MSQKKYFAIVWQKTSICQSWTYDTKLITDNWLKNKMMVILIAFVDTLLLKRFQMYKKWESVGEKKSVLNSKIVKIFEDFKIFTFWEQVEKNDSIVDNELYAYYILNVSSDFFRE